MNGVTEMVQSQLEHRTIREFTTEIIPPEVFEQLMEVARRTASSTCMQAASIIRVTDPAVRKQIAEVCKQEYAARAPGLLIFIMDQYRNYRIAVEKDCFEDSARDMDRFFQGYIDACLMAQNVVNAAESFGLGTVYFGSILNDSARICEILELPELTFPVVGLGIGYPGQSPQLKPRMEMRLRVFENSYTRFDSYLEEMKEYDEEMQTYYDLRDANRRLDSFSNQVVTRLLNPSPNRQEMLNAVRAQGFDLKVDE